MKKINEKINELITEMGTKPKKALRVKLFEHCTRSSETSKELLQQELNDFFLAKKPENIISVQTGSYKNFLLGSTMGEYEACWYAHVMYQED